MGACLEEGHLCILMEYCERGNLYEILHDVSQHIDYNKILKVRTELRGPNRDPWLQFGMPRRQAACAWSLCPILIGLYWRVLYMFVRRC